MSIRSRGSGNHFRNAEITLQFRAGVVAPSPDEPHREGGAQSRRPTGRAHGTNFLVAGIKLCSQLRNRFASELQQHKLLVHVSECVDARHGFLAQVTTLVEVDRLGVAVNFLWQIHIVEVDAEKWKARFGS